MFPTQRLFSSILCPNHTSCKLNPCLFSHNESTRPTVLVAMPAASITTKKRIVTSDTAIAGPSKLPKQERRVETNPIPGPSKLPAASYELAPRLAMGHLNSSHTGYPVRNSMLVALHKQFLLSYARLPARKRLAYEDALLQEAENYQKSVKATYRNLTVGSLGRLKKRPPAMREGDDNTGTLGTELKRNQEREEKEKGRLTRRKVDRYISTKEVLAKWEYLVDVPEQPGGQEPNEEGNIKKCDRVGCGIEFLVHSDLNEAEKIACAHHFGRLVTEKLGGIKQRVFSCCPGANALPCQQGPHVFRDSDHFQLHSRTAFVRTEEVTTPATALINQEENGVGGEEVKINPSIAAKLEIVALDCELVYTTSGMSLARLTVVDSEGDVVLDEHVKPNGALLDTNYRFSGVKLEHLAAAKLDISGVRKKLGEIIDEKTILVGHGLENDLKAMRLVHLNCIDTAIIFPHPRGFPFRNALRNLTRDVLGKFIQEGGSHSAVDDSTSALELVRFKMKQDL